MEKIALITGSGRGIGAATARLLAQKHYKLCINYKSNHEAAEQLAQELQQYDTQVITCQADTSKESDVVRLFTTIDQQLGAITALVNNVGILHPQMPITDISAERVNDILSQNVTSHIICSREAVKRMSTQFGGQGGAIVNVSSGAARTGSPGEYIDYAASKGAIDTFTIGLATEVAAQQIRVNAVRPGFIDTDIHADGGEPNRIERVKKNIPMQRGGQPEEAAAAIAWLLSDEASYVTGSFIDATGGR